MVFHEVFGALGTVLNLLAAISGFFLGFVFTKKYLKPKKNEWAVIVGSLIGGISYYFVSTIIDNPLFIIVIIAGYFILASIVGKLDYRGISNG